MRGVRSRLLTQSLHLSLVAQCYYLESALYDFTRPCSYFSLLVISLAVILYFLASLKDPGFVPLASIIEKTTFRHKQTISVSSAVTILSRQQAQTAPAAILDRNNSYQSLEASRLEVIESSQSSSSIPNEGSEENVLYKEASVRMTSPMHAKVIDDYTFKLPDSMSAEPTTVAPNRSELYELRFCISCDTDQPLRAKHCKECERCVGTYDHHCPWLGNCVGEKNKAFFYLFLLVQLLEIAFFLSNVCNFEDADNNSKWFEVNAWRLSLVVIGVILLALIGTLFAVHSFLLSRNMTTWEYFSWQKISYLEQWRHASPFDKGVLPNYMSCCLLAFQRKLHTWSLPTIEINS